MTEEWRAIPGFEGLYEVSDQGRVRSFHKSASGRLCKLSTHSHGYPVVGLYPGDGTCRVRGVHILVLEAFKGQPPPGEEGCHEDGEPSNCTLSNLRWGTHASNMADRTRHGRDVQGERNGVAKLTEADVAAIRNRAPLWTQRELGEEFGVHQSTISLIQNRKHWRHV